MSKEKDNLLGIDFGELVDTEVLAVINPDIKEETVDEGKESQQKEGEQDTLKLDINEVLSKEIKQTDTSTKVVKEDEVKGDDKTPAPDDIKNNSSSNSFALVFAKYLKEQGALSDLNEEELTSVFKEGKEADHIAYVKDLLVKNIHDDLKKEYDEDYQHFLELKGEGVDTETASNLVLSQVELNKISDKDIESDDNIELRKGIISEYYKHTMNNPDEKKIKKLVDNHISLGEDIEVAKENLSDLKTLYKEMEQKTIERSKQQEIENKKLMEENNKKIKETINSIDEIIPGQKINKQTKQKIEEAIFKPVKADSQGRQMNAIWSKRSEDPVKFDSILGYLLITGAFDGKWNKVETAVKTKAINEMKDFFNTGKSGEFRSVNRQQDDITPTESEMLNSMKDMFK